MPSSRRRCRALTIRAARDPRRAARPAIRRGLSMPRPGAPGMRRAAASPSARGPGERLFEAGDARLRALERGPQPVELGVEGLDFAARGQVAALFLEELGRVAREARSRTAAPACEGAEC